MSHSFRKLIDQLPWFLKPQIVGLALTTGLVLLLLVVGLGFLTRNQNSPVSKTTAILNVISAPTATSPAPTQLVDSTPTAQGESEGEKPGGDIFLDAYVQITGTGGTGLRVRLTPSLSGQVKFVASEAEIFLVKDGPLDADGYTWWYLVGPFDETRNGWAASNYLVLTQNP
jgi:hypothetical protein